MTTMANVVQRAKAKLIGSFREEASTLASAVGANATSLTLSTSPTQVGIGTVLCVVSTTGYELFYVTAWDPGTRIASVAAGYLGTTSVAHAQGDFVEINSRFPSAAVLQACVDEVNALPQALPAIYTSAYIPVGGGQYLVDLTAADPRFTVQAYTLLDLVIDKPDDGQYFGAVSGTQQPIRWVDYLGARLERLPYPNSGDPAHLLLRLGRNAGIQWISANLVVTIGAPAGTTGLLSPTADFETITGLASSVIDLIGLGVWIRLLGDQAANRSARGPFGESRTAQEVPAGLIMSDTVNRRREYNERLTQEVFKVRARYPIMMD